MNTFDLTTLRDLAQDRSPAEIARTILDNRYRADRLKDELALVLGCIEDDEDALLRMMVCTGP